MAIIRTRGGMDGIQLYLVNGKKSGRSFSRNELDERIVFGDLDFTDKIIQSIECSRERYIHTTISFKEDALRAETFYEIVKDFKDFAFAAYKDEEYNCYAEVHLPRMKSYVDENGKIVIRLPHIHVIIPRLNLLSFKDLNPFGLYMTNISFVDAFQEQINNKYGSASPSDNRRTEFTTESTILSRSKGDVFEGQNSAYKESILAEIIEKNITNYDDFQMLLKEKGETKTRNAGKINEHEAIKILGENQFINLRHFAFSREFIALPTVQKLERIETETKIEYCALTQPKPTLPITKKVLDDWRMRRCKEIKYLNSGNAKQYKKYRDATLDEKHKMLADYQFEFYKKYKKDKKGHCEAPLQDDLLINPLNKQFGPDETLLPPTAPTNPETGREEDTLIAQFLRDKSEEIRERSAANDPSIKEINLYLDADRLLMRLSHANGVILEKYKIEKYRFTTKGKQGGDRIRCGNRNYNVSDFLTKELHIPWAQASVILKDTYEAQMSYRNTVQARAKPDASIWRMYQIHLKVNFAKIAEEKRITWKIQRECEKDRLAGIKASFYAEKSKIYADKNLSKADRRTALSLCIMERVTNEARLRAQKAVERAELKRDRNLSHDERFRQFLLLRAREGDEAALAELRRQRVTDSHRYVTDAAFSTRDDVAEPKPQPKAVRLIDLNYEVDRDGNVTYLKNDIKILMDEGRLLKILDADDDTVVEVAIRCAYAKFGSKIKITGNTEFREKVARIVARENLHIEFDDQFTNDRIEEFRREGIMKPVGNHSANIPTPKIK